MAVKLSIVVTCFNDSEKFYEKNSVCLKELTSRTDIELIIINTFGRNSVLNTQLQELAALSSNIKIYSTVSQSRQGVGRNIGINKCSGEYLWFIDSDDVFAVPTKQILSKLTANFISTNYVMRTPQGDIKYKTNGSNGLNAKSCLFLLATNRISNACWPYFYATQKVKKNKIEFKDTFFEDMIFNTEFLGLPNQTYQHISICLYDYHYSYFSTSRTKTLSRIMERWNATHHAVKALFRSKTLNAPQKFYFAALYFAYHGIWLTLR